MNEPLAFRNGVVTARRTAEKTAVEHALLSETMASQANECVKLGEIAQRVHKGSTGYAEQQRVVRAQFDEVNQSVTDVRDFITEAKNGQVDADSISLASMRTHHRTLERHARTLSILTNK